MRNFLSSPIRSVRQRPRATRCRRMSLERLEDRQLLTAVAPPDGLVSWWTAENTTADLKSLNNGTWDNGTEYVPGEVGQAFHFDGYNRVVLADTPSLAFTGSMSIEGWVRVDGLPNRGVGLGAILFRGDDRGGLDPYQLSIDPNGSLYFQVENASGAAARVSAPIAIGQFTHVAATLDDATGAMTLYENGAVVARTVTTVRPFGPLDPNYHPGVGIGNYNGTIATSYNAPFYGPIDELAVYNRAISAGEVAGIYNAAQGARSEPRAIFRPTIRS